MEIQKKRTAHRLHKSKAAVEVPPEPSTSSVDLNYEESETKGCYGEKTN
jgi:hypothetical protein